MRWLLRDLGVQYLGTRQDRVFSFHARRVPVLAKLDALVGPSDRESQRSSLDWLPNSDQCLREICFVGGL